MFRIISRRWLYYGRRVRDLGPGYTCGPEGRSCRRSEKQWARGCPDCALTNAYRIFRDDTTEELIDAGGWPRGYNFPRLLGLLLIVVNAQGANPDRVNPDWDLTFSHLVEILQGERNRIAAIDVWSMKKD